MLYLRRFLLAGMISVTVIGLAPGIAQAANVVKAKSSTFVPDSITIPAGARVKWRNPSTRSHTVTSTSSNWSKNSNLNPGNSTTFTFNQTGTYSYKCNIHSGMTGKVIVN